MGGLHRQFGIAVQITSIVVLIVAGLVFLVLPLQEQKARDVVIEHEKVDLREETRNIAFELADWFGTLRHDVTVATHQLKPFLESPHQLTDKELEGPLPDHINGRYLRIEIIPLGDQPVVPGKLLLRAEKFSIAMANPVARNNVIKQFKQSQPNRVFLTQPQSLRKDKFNLVEPDKPKLKVNNKPPVLSACYNVIWGGARIESSGASWIVMFALPLDEIIVKLTGSPRHLGYLLTGDKSPQPIFPTVVEGGEMEKAIQAKFDPDTGPHSPGVEVNKDIKKKFRLEGQPFWFRETEVIKIKDTGSEKSVQRAVRALNRKYVDEEWNPDTGETRRHRVSWEHKLRRLRVNASDESQLDVILEAVKETIGAEIEEPENIGWRMPPVKCDSCYLSRARIQLNPEWPEVLEEDSQDAQSLVLMRAAFVDELSADVNASLASVNSTSRVAGILAVLAALGLSFFITRPLKRITDAAKTISKAIGQKDLADSTKESIGRLPVRRWDEIGGMARALRELVGQIESDASAIREREQRLRGVFNTALDGIMTIDEEGRIESFNKAAEGIFGWTQDEVINKHFEIIYPDHVAARLKERLRRYLDFSDPSEPEFLGKRKEVEGRRKDGSIFPLELSVSELKLSDGRRIFTSFLRDITEQKEADKTRQLNLELQESNKEKARQLRLIGHEVKTLLTPFACTPEIWRANSQLSLSSKESELLKRIEDGVFAIEQVVEVLREVARIDRGRAVLNYGDFSPEKVIKSVESGLQAEIERKKHDVKLELEHAPKVIQADEKRFRQVVQNLLTNACKYTPMGGKIVIRARIDDDQMFLEVEDTGIGIPEEDHEKVFSNFQRASNAESLATGLGLGLALCRNYIDLHHGEIGFKTELGNGTTFWVTLPIRAVIESAREKVSDEEATMMSTAPSQRILIVDPQRDQDDSLQRILDGSQHTFETVSNGKELMQRIGEFEPDIVITAAKLSDMNAPEVLSCIREQFNADSVKVVVMSMNDMAFAASLGFTAALKLPVHSDQLDELFEVVKAADTTVAK